MLPVTLNVSSPTIKKLGTSIALNPSKDLKSGTIEATSTIPSSVKTSIIVNLLPPKDAKVGVLENITPSKSPKSGTTLSTIADPKNISRP